MIQTLIREFLHSLRQFRKQPRFFLTCVFTLALAIGASTLIFSVVEAVLLRPLPFRDPSRLVLVKENVSLLGSQAANLPAPDVLRFINDTHSFESAGGFVGTQMEFSGRGEPVQLHAMRMTASVLPTLGVKPILGRFFTRREDDTSQSVAILSYQLWKSRFQGNPEVLGQHLMLDRKTYVVIGVMPHSFEFPLTTSSLSETQIWIPMSFTKGEKADAGDNWRYGLVARLRSSVTRGQAETDANRVAKNIQAEYPAKMNVKISAVLIGLKEETVQQARPLIDVLFGAVTVVLLVACANVAGLLLIRAVRRQREVAILVALGAPPSAVVRQPIIESLLLSCGGAVIGVLLAALFLSLWTKLLPDTLPRVQEIRLNWKVAEFAMVLALVTGFICGLAPAISALRTTVTRVLQHGVGSGQSVGHVQLRSLLVVGEIAAAIVLLTSAGLLVRSFENMRNIDPGFQPDHLITGSYTLQYVDYQNQGQINYSHEEVLRRIQRLPGVKAVGLSNSLPIMEPDSIRAFNVESYRRRRGEPVATEANAYVVGNFLQTMQIPLLRGRYLNDKDTADSIPVIVVNRTLAERYWPGQNPVGKRVRWGSEEANYKRPWMTVVGEVADTKQGALDTQNMAQAYEPLVQYGAEFGSIANKMGLHGSTMRIAVRTQYDPQYAEGGIRRAVQSMDSRLPVTNMQTMEQAVSKTEAPRRFNTGVVSLFASVAVGLAALGIYAVIAFSVAQRTHEMGIRVALGAQAFQVMKLVLSGGLRLGLLGCAIGVLGAIGVSRLLSSFLFQVSPFDPLIYFLAVFGVLLLACAASFFPALRAAAVDPIEALRVD